MSDPEYMRRYRANAKAAGLCCSCNTRPARKGKRQCERCSIKRRERENKRYASGMCSCGKRPRPEGKRYCQPCKDRWKRWYVKPENRIKWNKYTKGKNAEIRLRVLAHYGGKCICCGESGVPFLTIDHLRNGKEDRAKCNSGYWWRTIVKLGFPDHLQILCWNCNMAKQHFGKGVDCPHRLTQPS